MNKKWINYKDRMPLSKTSAYLAEIITCLNSGKLCLQHDDNYVLLLPKNQIAIELSAEDKANKQKLSIKLSWYNEIIPEKKEPTLKISSTTPQIPKKPVTDGPKKKLPNSKKPIKKTNKKKAVRK